MRHRKKNQASEKRSSACCTKCCSRCFEKLAVRNTRRTCRFTRAASKTAIDVRVNSLVVHSEISLEQRSHEEDSSARTVVLVLESLIRRTRLETKAAVHALIDTRQRCFERSTRKRAGWSCISRCRRLVYYFEGNTHVSGPSIPGLRTFAGSNALLIR